eukprot:TRINITY_DN64761_c0_g1_i1.p1 TRINITY_DN64761_c0_g1~~TRINITY_DN64761_c0_g1_i1.p1  ORF type:complete len:585 (-),score=70.17 TRINITY_DN64761_c0_g1_i1:76-1710(-)
MEPQKMEDTTSPAKEPGATEQNNVLSICKTCGYMCMPEAEKAHTQETQHAEFQSIKDFADAMLKNIQEKKAGTLQLQQKLFECKQSAHHELLLSQSITGAGYSTALRAMESLKSQLNVQKGVESELQAALAANLKKVDEHDLALTKFNESFENDLKTISGDGPEKIADIANKYKEYEANIKEVQNTIANTSTLLNKIHSANYSSMSTIVQLFSMAPVEAHPTTRTEELKKEMLAKAEDVKAHLEGWKTTFSNLKTTVDKGISEASSTQAELSKRLISLEQKLDDLRQGALKEKFCSLCKKEEECLHRMDCKHKICRGCAMGTIVDQMARDRKISVQCWKCGKTCTQVSVELHCGCIEDVLPKRDQIVQETHGDVFVYNSITLQCVRPNCRNQHEMIDEDLLLFFDKAFLEGTLGTIDEIKQKDEMTSLRKEMSELVNETRVDLSGKLIGNDEARLVADFIKINPKLKTLDLSTNELRDEGIIEIAEALRNHNAIVKLDLRGNKFGEMGKNYMQEVNEAKGMQMRILYFYITMYLIKPPSKQQYY